MEWLKIGCLHVLPQPLLQKAGGFRINRDSAVSSNHFDVALNASYDTDILGSLRASSFQILSQHPSPTMRMGLQIGGGPVSDSSFQSFHLVNLSRHFSEFLMRRSDKENEKSC